MSKLIRFGVAVEENLLSRYDKYIKGKQYSTRSKAISDMMEESLLKKEWAEGKTVYGAITLVYDHHKRELTESLTLAQHDMRDVIISTQHIHLDHDSCLEIIAVKGMRTEIEKLANILKATKGVKNSSLAVVSAKP